MSPESSNSNALEVQLALDVKECRTCQWFWGGIPPYGPYPSFDWSDTFPEAFREEERQNMSRTPSFLMEAKYTGYKKVDPAIMHGCRKAPIMTIGINPNLTSYFKGTTSAAWVYPCFSGPANYAYYYRFQTIYQESVDQKIISKHLVPGTEIKAAHDGWLLDVTRGSDHRWMELTLQYECELDTRSLDLAWGTDARYILRVNRVKEEFTIGKKFSFKKGATIAAKLDFSADKDGLIYKNPTPYYQRFIPVLDGLTEHINKNYEPAKEVALSIGEDVSQHDMIACASPGWSEKFDIPMETITRKCVGEKAFALLQVLQSKPAVLVIVGRSSMEMFGKYFGPYLDIDYKGRDVYHLLQETCTRKKYLTINLEDYQLKSRIIICPHFSYYTNYISQAHFSSEAWRAFQKDFPADVEVLRDKALQDKYLLKEDGYNGVAAIKIKHRNDPLKRDISPAGWSIIMAYYYNPEKMMSKVLIEEFDEGHLALDGSVNHLQRTEGPCSFCHNELWNFIPEKGCLYGNNTAQYQDGFLEGIARKLLNGF